MIWQHRQRMHVAFDRACCPENFATNWMSENVRLQSLGEARSFWEFKDATVINDAGADVTAMQRNNPDPPAAPKKMIRGPLTRGAAIVSVIRKTLPPFIAVPLLDAAESRPDSIDRV